MLPVPVAKVFILFQITLETNEYMCSYFRGTCFSVKLSKVDVVPLVYIFYSSIPFNICGLSIY